MFNKIKKQKRGFSLVELMVVVAIMGTLSAIAIPAYNDYRKSAKKTAYRSDLSGLHKGWLAFGVENDDFCERETSPSNASISNVGMSSLTNSKLYGVKGACEDPGTPITGCSCTGQSGSTACSSHQNSALTSCGCNWNASADNNAPGKHNFIGFTDASNCANITADSDVQILGEQQGALTNAAAGCGLDITTYQMGVYGHISGKDYYGISINNVGVLSSEEEFTDGQGGFSADAADANCT